MAALAIVTTVGLVVPLSVTAASAAESAGRTRGTPSKSTFATLEVDAPTVEVKPAGKSSFVAGADGRELEAGDTVRTSSTGLAQINYADGSLTRLDVDTEYKVVKLTTAKGVRKTKGLQSAGQTWHRVEKLTGSESYKVEGANTTAAVLGTAFVVKCVARNQCTFTAVVDDVALTPDGQPKTGTKTVTLTPGDQVTVDDSEIGNIATLTQEDLLAIAWINQNLIADEQDGKSIGPSEVGAQADPPPTRPPSTPLATPPPPAPVTDAGTGTGTGTGGVPANEGPTALDDSYSMPEDTLLVIAAPGVLVNDGDPEGDPLEAFLTSLPAHGAIQLSSDGTLIYFPDANFSGVDSFTYVAGDGEFGSSPATVTITVGAVNDAPVAVDDAYTTDEDTLLQVTAPGVLGNDTDLDGNALTAVLVTDAGDGDLTLHADGSFSYLPDANFHGVDSFTYRVNDVALVSSAVTVTITVGAVNDAPDMVADSYDADENTLLEVDAVDGVLANDSDADGDELTAVRVDDAANGHVELAADGSFTYMPDETFFGTDQFTYFADDGDGPYDPVTVTINVDEYALAETIAVIHEVDSGGTVMFALSTNGATSVTIASLPGSGQLLVGGEPVETPMDIAPGTSIEYQAPDTGEGPEQYSFTWTATNDDGTTGELTEYLWVGGDPVIPDAFAYGTEGQPTTIDVYVNSPDLGEFTCAIWEGVASNQGTVGSVTFHDGYWTMVFTPAAGTGGTIIVLHVSAGFSPGCAGPWAEFGNAYVAVGYTGDSMPAPEASVSYLGNPLVGPIDAESGSAVQFTVTATDPNGLPVDILFDGLDTSTVEGPPGTLTLVSHIGDQWTFEWTPDTPASSYNTVHLKVTNLAGIETPVSVTINYSPGEA
ncbi:MAG: Ig-like domain-containing protein [Acidimicrobiia bacterium]|jgi:hypothetical protein